MAGAKVQAMTVLDILLTPKIVADAWDYFNNVQTEDVSTSPFFAPTDQPPIWLNADIMAKYRPEMKKFYYDPEEVPVLSRPARHQVSDRAKDRAVERRRVKG